MRVRVKKVWGTAVMAILATVILVGVIIGLCASDAPHDPHTPLPKATFPSLGTAFGVILFGFGGHGKHSYLRVPLSSFTVCLLHSTIQYRATIAIVMVAMMMMTMMTMMAVLFVGCLVFNADPLWSVALFGVFNDAQPSFLHFKQR